MKTNDIFKQHRRWLQDLMTPDFLQHAAAPRIYTAFEELIHLWSEKTRLSKGHPFAAAKDIHRSALDVVWSVMFAVDPSTSATRSQVLHYTSLKTLDCPSDVDQEVQLPHASDPEAFKAVLTLTRSLEITNKSPFPVLTRWVLPKLPYMRKAWATKEKYIAEQVESSLRRLSVNEEARCALDNMLSRERLLSKKEDRNPMFHSRAMYDEILGFIIAAHDTTAATISWGLKMFADHQDVQSKLRSTLLSSFPDATTGKRAPTHQEIIKTPIPYLDAVVEEVIRFSKTAPATLRTAETDVEVLGKRIPKGTELLLMIQASSIFSPAFDIPDSLRSPSFHAANEKIGSWDEEDMADFKPERWLKNGEFDPTAGPMLSFGLGPRGCYGRRMAYLKLKIEVVLVLWAFELERCPEALSGWEAVEKMVRAPQKCFVRLRKL